MKIYCDENIEVAIVEGLKRRGVDIVTVKDVGSLGKSDEFHIENALKMKAVILTHDVDYLNIAHKWRKEGKEHCGILYAHPQKLSIGECIRKVELAIKILTSEEMKNHIEFL